MIIIKNLNPIKIKVDKKSCENALICYIGYVTVKNLSYAKINSVNPLYLASGCIDKSNGSKYLTLVPTDESKTMKKYTTNQ